MKTYKVFTRSAAMVITQFGALLLTSASRFFSPIETQTTVVLPGADPTSSLASESVRRPPVEVRRSAVKENYSRASVALAAVAAFAVLCGPSVAAAEENICDAQLTVELSPSVPRASDDGFLSSLLNNNFAYHLELLRQEDSSVIEVDLRGPGPSYRCQNVIESMRKDARVESIRVEST